MMLKVFTIFFIFLFTYSVDGIGQDKTYSLSVAGKDIGKLKVFELKKINDITVQKVESEFKFLFQTGKFVNESSFSKGRLLEARSIHSINGNVKEITNTKLLPSNHYKVIFSENNSEKKEIKSLQKNIHGTLTGLFYSEPVGSQEVYSERFGVFCPVKLIAAGSYEVRMPDGKRNVYTYEKGECNQLQTELAGFKLLLVLDKKTSL